MSIDVILRRIVHHSQLLEMAEDGPFVQLVQGLPVQDQVLGAEQLLLPQQDGQDATCRLKNFIIRTFNDLNRCDYFIRSFYSFELLKANLIVLWSLRLSIRPLLLGGLFK